jgi:hypothetical protein
VRIYIYNNKNNNKKKRKKKEEKAMVAADGEGGGLRLASHPQRWQRLWDAWLALGGFVMLKIYLFIYLFKVIK